MVGVYFLLLAIIMIGQIETASIFFPLSKRPCKNNQESIFFSFPRFSNCLHWKIGERVPRALRNPKYLQSWLFITNWGQCRVAALRGLEPPFLPLLPLKYYQKFDFSAQIYDSPEKHFVQR